MTFVLCVFGGDGVREKQDCMPLVGMNFEVVGGCPWPADMVAGIMVHPTDASLVEFFADVVIIAVQLTEVVGEIEAVMEAEVDSRVDASTGIAVGAAFDLVDDGFLRPLEVGEVAPPGCGTVGYETSCYAGGQCAGG